jgi:hypothetical protein
MKPVLALVLVTAVSSAANVRTIAGQLAIGTMVYTASGTLSEDADTIGVSMTLTGSDDREHTITVLLGKDASASLNGVPITVPAATASRWRGQLRGGLEVPPDRFECAFKGIERVCNSRELFELTEGLAGRLRLTYNGSRLVGLRFYSLAEFNNVFFQNVSLTLDFR